MLKRAGGDHVGSWGLPGGHIEPGETVRPAHSHPNGEEVIYIVRGNGRVMVEGEDRAEVQGLAERLADVVRGLARAA